MDETQAIERVRSYLTEHYSDYSTEGLVARRFDAGWSVYASVPESTDIETVPLGVRIFMVGDWTSEIMESSSSHSPQQRAALFHQRYG